MIEYLVENTLKPHYKKRFFGKDYILFNDYFINSYILSEHCLNLGYIYKNNFSNFIELFTDNTDKDGVLDSFKKFGESKKNEIKNEIFNTYELFLETEIQKVIDNLFSGINIHNVEDLNKIKDKKIPITLVETLTNLLVYKSIGFGINYPQICENLFNYEIDDEKYKEAYEVGLNIPKEKNIMSINERINLTKSIIRPYVKKNRPDLIDVLDLK